MILCYSIAFNPELQLDLHVSDYLLRTEKKKGLTLLSFLKATLSSSLLRTDLTAPRLSRTGIPAR